MAEFPAFATQARAHLALRDVTSQVDTILRYACPMGNLSAEGWVALRIDASQKATAAPSPGQSRGSSPSGIVPIVNGAQVCTKATPPPPNATPRGAKGGKDEGPHKGTAVARQDDTGATWSTELSPPTDKTIPKTSSSDSVPREKILFTKREYVSLDPETLQ